MACRVQPWPGRRTAEIEHQHGRGYTVPSALTARQTSPCSTITIGSFDPLGAGATQQRRVEGYWAIVDNASHTTGNHNIKFGIEIRRPYFSGAAYASSTSSVRGAASFGTGNVSAFAKGTPASTVASPLEDFLDGVPSTGAFLFGDPTVVVRAINFGTFVQDDWRITQKLTLNLGLRYEYENPLTEDSNKLSNFDPTLGLVQVGHGIGQPWKPYLFGENLQPRFGAVYDVTGKAHHGCASRLRYLQQLAGMAGFRHQRRPYQQPHCGHLLRGGWLNHPRHRNNR